MVGVSEAFRFLASGAHANVVSVVENEVILLQQFDATMPLRLANHLARALHETDLSRILAASPTCTTSEKRSKPFSARVTLPSASCGNDRASAAQYDSA